MLNMVQQDITTVQLTAPGGGVTGGTPAVVSGLFGVPVATAAASAKFAHAIAGVFTLTKSAPLEIAEGDRVFWNSSTGVTKTVTDRPIGFAVEVGASAATTIDVWVFPQSLTDAIALAAASASATTIAATAAGAVEDRLDGAYQISFVGASAAGYIALTSAVKTAGAVPAEGDRIIMLQGYVTATGVPVAMPTIGTDFEELLVTDTTVKVEQLSASDLSDNTYVALVLPVA